ncbi:Protein of unknown function [Cotesia congregata]|uniref:Uncharacterized protein n=1 Tax=Cotesia congregata TaxID=51543 RepID=A0A8J2MJN0_COTCN|nr:Protein of unknown function [Cotesia congregata]
MDQKIKCSLIIAGAIVIAGTAIWCIWSLLKEDPETKRKLRKELNEIVEKASALAVDTFITTKSNEFINDKSLFEVMILGVSVFIYENDIRTEKDNLKRNRSNTNQAMIDRVEDTVAYNKAYAKANDAIVKKAKEIAEELISIKIREKVSWQSEKAAKSATDDAVYKLVEQGSSVEKTAKDEISKNAKKAAEKVVKRIISDTVLSTIKSAVQTEGYIALQCKLDDIKIQIIHDVILNEANLGK